MHNWSLACSGSIDRGDVGASRTVRETLRVVIGIVGAVGETGVGVQIIFRGYQARAIRDA